MAISESCLSFYLQSEIVVDVVKCDDDEDRRHYKEFTESPVLGREKVTQGGAAIFTFAVVNELEAAATEVAFWKRAHVNN